LIINQNCENGYYSGDVDNSNNIYFIFDAPGSDAFAHWVFETCICSSILVELNKIYPNIIVLTTNRKKYVSSYLKFLNINNNIEYDILNIKNTCFFPPLLSLNSSDKRDLPTFLKYVNIFINQIKEQIISLNPIQILLLPRNSLDNYQPNDVPRIKNEELETNIISIGGTSLNTYQLNNMFIQLSIIHCSNIIILDYGSSFFVNCISIKNKKIIVLDHDNLINSQLKYVCMKTLFDIINENNTVIITHPTRFPYQHLTTDSMKR